MARKSGYEGNEFIEVKLINGKPVDIYGCFYKDTPENEYDFYDLYYDGQCINLGEPCYEYPTDDDITAFLELQEALEED